MLESKSGRTVERSMMQVQTLVDSINETENSDDRKSRLNFIYSCCSKPFWNVEGELVTLLKSLGSTKAALESALRLKLWEDVIECYHALQLRHKAAEVIRDQLKIKETPLLYCMLGDATDELEHYHKALEMTNNKSSRAYRSLGYYYYFRKEYKTCIDFMTKSVALNGFQKQLLLRLGYAATMDENWEIAASAYRKYCVLETDNFEAWNNLSNAYIKLGQKSRAWKVLQEAVKCDYDNWKVWDNIMLVSTDCAHFEEVIKAYNRILDIKAGDKHVDNEVLSILTRAIIEDLKDNYERPCGKLFRQPALKLFGRLTASNPSESKIWSLYSQLVDSDSEMKADERDYKAAQLMQKSVAAAMKEQNWEKVTEKCDEILELTHSLYHCKS